MANFQESKPSLQTLAVKDRAAWKTALASGRPVLVHLNADSTWLLQLPVPTPSSGAPEPTPGSNSGPGAAPPPGPTHFNVLLDPWLRGPQSDVAGWFSTQWHVVPSSVQSLAELADALAEVEGGGGRRREIPVDAVVVSHEFTDHCHRETLLELSQTTPVFATEKAAELIRSWGHFETVVDVPGYSASTAGGWRGTLSVGPLPEWLGIGRVISEGNALYYHSAVVVAFDLTSGPGPGTAGDVATRTASPAEAILYSPHGVAPSDLSFLHSAGSGLRTLALLHGLHDVRLWPLKQLNLGGLNGAAAASASGARYWVGTHDEVKKGTGMIGPMLRRRIYTLDEAVVGGERNESTWEFLELGSGDAIVLR